MLDQTSISRLDELFPNVWESSRQGKALRSSRVTVELRLSVPDPAMVSLSSKLLQSLQGFWRWTLRLVGDGCDSGSFVIIGVVIALMESVEGRSARGRDAGTRRRHDLDATNLVAAEIRRRDQHWQRPKKLGRSKMTPVSVTGCLCDFMP